VAVRDVVKDERDRKLREREEWLQIKTYHESILKKGTLDEYMSHSGSTRLIGQFFICVYLNQSILIIFLQNYKQIPI
jgi:hypothetical protein